MEIGRGQMVSSQHHGHNEANQHCKNGTEATDITVIPSLLKGSVS